MSTNSNQKPASSAGFHEKNFLKLKEGKLWEYIASRIITFVAGVSIGFLFLLDAAYVHSPTGLPRSVIFACAIIFAMNGIRKMMWGFIKMNAAAWNDRVVESPHDPHETIWQRVFLRMPIGQRRHLIARQALAAEGLALVLLIMHIISRGVNDNLFVLSSEFPFVLNAALFTWTGWRFPENIYEGILITSGAVIISYWNNSLFLTKIPQVREVLLSTAEKMVGGKTPWRAVAAQALDYVRHRQADGQKPSLQVATVAFAEVVLSLYSSKVSLDGHYDELLVALVSELERQKYDAGDTSAMWAFLDAKLEELKKTPTK